MSAAALPTMGVIQLRTSWKVALAWVLSLGATMVLTTTSISNLYNTQDKIDSYAEAAGSGNALFFINGHIAGLDTLGGVIADEFGFIASFAIPLMGISLIARMTRKDEDAGRLETLLAGRIGRSAPVVSAALVASAALLLTALASLAALVAAGVDLEGAVLYSVSLALLGVVFVGVAAVAAQLVEHSRGVYGIGLGTLVLAYLLRGTGDVLDNAVTWLSPLGWAEKTEPYGDPRWWPVLVPVAIGGLLIAVAAVLSSRRDLGSAVLRQRASDPAATPFLRTPLGLALRLHRGAILGWTVIAVVTTVTFGSLAQQLIDAMAGNASLEDAFGGTGSASIDGVLALSVLLLALMCAGYVLQAVGTVRAEETSGRLESTLSGEVGRLHWLGVHLAVVLGGLVVVGGVGGVGLAVATAWSTGDSGQVGRSLTATAAYVPAVLVLGGIAVAMFGLLPRAESVGWLVFAAAAVVAYLGQPLNMPDWIVNVAPFNRTGYPPLDPSRTGDLVGMTVIALALAAAGFGGFRRRGIPAG